MKIAVTITLDVNPDDWNNEYMSDASREEIRADVIQYVTTTMQAIFGVDGSDGVKSGVRSVSVRPGGRGAR